MSFSFLLEEGIYRVLCCGQSSSLVTVTVSIMDRQTERGQRKASKSPGVVSKTEIATLLVFVQNSPVVTADIITMTELFISSKGHPAQQIFNMICQILLTEIHQQTAQEFWKCAR